MNLLRALLNIVIFITLPFWGGVLVFGLTLHQLYKGDAETKRQFVEGRDGFFYEFAGTRTSGVVLFLNWTYLILSPVWAGCFVTYTWLSQTFREELKDTFILGKEWFWEV